VSGVSPTRGQDGDDDYDYDGYRRRPSLDVRKRKRGLQRLLNFTWLGALLGGLGGAGLMFLALLADARRGAPIGPMLGGMVCVGILGATGGVLAGWFIDTLIHIVRVASRPGGTRRPRREDDE
jgi:hypothetical protein